MAKNVSLGKILAELKSAISELEKEDPTWSDQQKKKAKSSVRTLRNLHELVAENCTEGSQMVPGA
jgi:hypothetical protein